MIEQDKQDKQDKEIPYPAQQDKQDKQDKQHAKSQQAYRSDFEVAKIRPFLLQFQLQTPQITRYSGKYPYILKDQKFDHFGYLFGSRPLKLRVTRENTPRF